MAPKMVFMRLIYSFIHQGVTEKQPRTCHGPRRWSGEQIDTLALSRAGGFLCLSWGEQS